MGRGLEGSVGESAPVKGPVCGSARLRGCWELQVGAEPPRASDRNLGSLDFSPRVWGSPPGLRLGNTHPSVLSIDSLTPQNLHK